MHSCINKFVIARFFARGGRNVLFSLALAIIAVVATVISPVAMAQAPTKVFVASTGNDANDGSRGSPKRNFQAAHDAVAAGDQIVVRDAAGYGAPPITKSVSVTVPPGINGFVTVSGSNRGIAINAGSSGSVSLRGLIIEGGGSTAGGYGIFVNATVGQLSIEDCTVRDFADGIFFLTSNDARLYVYNTTARGCGFGLVLHPLWTAPVATLSGCRFEQNNNIALQALGDGATRHQHRREHGWLRSLR